MSAELDRLFEEARAAGKLPHVPKKPLPTLKYTKKGPPVGGTGIPKRPEKPEQSNAGTAR